MTHFTVGIIVPPSELSHLHGFIDRQMEPYDENTEVAPHVCYGIEQAEAELERDRHRLQRIIEREDPDYNLEKCREMLGELAVTTAEQRFAEYIRCHELFNEKGEPLSTYNEDGKWDWYRIGGRWDGWITGNERSSEHGFNFSPDHETTANNMASVEDALQRDVIPHAIITPDGTWHERGQMGWWAMLITENDDWNAQAREILSGYPGRQLIIIDAHI